MLRKTLVIAIIFCLISSFAFSLPVPSQDEGDAPQSEAIGGGGQMTDQELILVIVGGVLGTIILLSILN